jgi:hypothetical protein
MCLSFDIYVLMIQFFINSSPNTKAGSGFETGFPKEVRP